MKNLLSILMVLALVLLIGFTFVSSTSEQLNAQPGARESKWNEYLLYCGSTTPYNEYWITMCELGGQTMCFEALKCQEWIRL